MGWVWENATGDDFEASLSKMDDLEIKMAVSSKEFEMKTLDGRSCSFSDSLSLIFPCDLVGGKMREIG